MKKLILTFLFATQLIFTLSANAQVNQDWKWLNPAPQGNALYWVKMWNANNWYAVGDNGTFMKTTNAGQNWYINHRASALLGSGEATSLYCAYFFNQNTGFVAGSNFNLSYYSGGGIFKTTNGGVTFDSVPGFRYDKPISYYQFFFVNNNFGYIVGNYWDGGVYYPMIYKTSNSGQTWTSVGQNITQQSVKARSVYAWDTANVIVCANFGEVYKSTDAGETWTYAITGNSTDLSKVKFINMNTGFTTGLNTFRYTTNGGVNWTIPASFPSRTYYDLNVCNTSNGLAVYLTGDNYNIFRTTNLGISWDTIHLYQTNPSVASTNYASDVSLSGDTLLTVGYFGMINRTMGLSNMTNFTNKSRGGIINDLWVQGLGSGNIIVVGNYTSSQIPIRDQITRSTDGGLTWIKSMIQNSKHYITSASFIDANTGWVTDNRTGRPYKTTDGGNSWVQQQIVDNASLYIYDIQMIDANTGYFCGGLRRVYKTTNGGDLWDTCSTPTLNTNGTLTGLYFINVNVGVAVGYNGITFITTNAGVNWNLENTSGGMLHSVYMTPNGKMFAVADMGQIMKNESVITGIEPVTTEIPNSYSLFQNYPNPFNPTTVIQFKIPKAGFISLKVFDITGKEVQDIYNNVYFNPGIETITFDGSELSSGVYFYSLYADNKFVTAKKMLLIK